MILRRFLQFGGLRLVWQYAKIHEVDEQEGEREAQVHLALAFQVEVYGEAQWYRHPAQIEEASHEVGESAVVQVEPLARD